MELTDLVKEMVENVKEKYPVLIAETIPSKISYGLLTDTMKYFMKKSIHKGNNCLYLVRIIEYEDFVKNQK